jgi:predicted GNAT family acetyltransferase
MSQHPSTHAPHGLDIRHNAAASRFEATVDGLLCRADYRREGDVLHLVHTEVPPSLEGRGIAAKLVRAAIDHARDHGLRILPRCGYVRAWVRRHPEIQDLLPPGTPV